MPKQDLSESKSNPFITKRTSKSLLTPCRQIGLSRKRKTPNSIEKPTQLISEAVNSTLSTTPLSSKNVLSTENVKLKIESEGQNEADKIVESDQKSPVIQVPNSPIKSEINAVNNNLASKKQEKSKIRQTKKNKKEVPSLNTESNPDVDKSKKSKSNKQKNETPMRKSKSTPQKKDNMNISNESPGDSDFVTNKSKIPDNKSKTSSTKTRKVAKRILSSDEEEESITLAKPLLESNLSTIDEKLNQEIIHDNNDVREINNSAVSDDIKPNKKRCNKIDSSDEEMPKGNINNASKKFKRCLSIKKSSEDQSYQSSPINIKSCTVKLKSIDGGSSDTNTEIDINKLEAEIIEKRKLVQDLKQAATHLKKIDDLKKSTMIWKNGCISALNDLLTHLQPYGNFDMATLLTKLRIPPEKISIAPSGELV